MLCTQNSCNGDALQELSRKKWAYPAIFFEQFPTLTACSMGSNSQGRQVGWWVVLVVHWSEAETLDGCEPCGTLRLWGTAHA